MTLSEKYNSFGDLKRRMAIPLSVRMQMREEESKKERKRKEEEEDNNPDLASPKLIVRDKIINYIINFAINYPTAAIITITSILTIITILLVVPHIEKTGLQVITSIAIGLVWSGVFSLIHDETSLGKKFFDKTGYSNKTHYQRCLKYQQKQQNIDKINKEL